MRSPVRRPLLALLAPCLLAAAAPDDPYAVAAPAPEGYDRGAVAARAMEHLVALVALDTQNPPGNELLTARYLESVLAPVEGIETEVIEVGENRANFVARLRAEAPTEGPVIVMGHMDVVGAQLEKWATDPFEATVVDGYVYGRGVIDDKGFLAATAALLPVLAARRGDLERDVVLLATAAEEGGPGVGVDHVLEHRPDVVAGAAFALNEGGRIRVQDGRIRTVNVQTTEKIPYNVTVRATGPSGHGSVPLPDNALAALARAVARLHEWRAPARLNDTTRLYFEKLALVEPDPAVRQAMLDLVGGDEEASAAAAATLSADPLHSAVLRAGQSLTLLDGGIRTNVIPSEGTANFNLRVLPDDDVTAIVDLMRAAAGEPSVTLELIDEPREAPPVSPVTTKLYGAMESAATTMAPGVVVLPFMSTGATDGAALRAAGIPTYGVLPLPLEMEDELRMHGDDERAPVPALGWAAEYLYRVLLGAST